MRALAKFQSGILRVEDPPISSIRVVKLPNEQRPKLSVRIRFAFDAIRVVSNGGRTVRLETKTSPNPQLPTASTSNVYSSPPSFSTISELESSHVSKVNKITVKIFEFDVMRSIPDEALTPLKEGLPIEYSYLLSIPAAQESYSPVTRALSDRDYLISRLESGIDPATLSETFPVSDPANKLRSRVAPVESYYTRPVSSKSNYRRMKIYSSYQVFEQEVLMSPEEFLSSTFYEFSYLDHTGTPIEFTEVKVQSSEIYSDFQKLQYSSQDGLVSDRDLESFTPETVRFEREIVSTTSLVSTEFSAVERNSRTLRPRVIRTHYKIPGSQRLSIKFESRVIGLPSKRSKVSSKSNSSKPAIIPFYINFTGEATYAVIKKLPPKAMRVGVQIRNVTKGDDYFTEIVTQRVTSENSNEIPINFPQNDCVYEIRVTSTDRKQRTITSCNSIVYNYLNPYKNAFMRVSKPSLLGDQRVKFTVRADFNDAGRQDLVNLIDIINASRVSSTTLSAEGFISDPKLYSEVFSFRVEKIDFETGEQSYTKEIPLTAQGVDFIDRLDTSSGAVYVFSLGMRSPASLIPSQSSYKFGTFGGRYLQSLPSNASAVDDLRSGAPFEKIDSGIKSIVNVPNSTLRGAISSIRSSQTMRNTNLIEWVYEGDITEVDHFQVFGSADGVECLLGCSFRETSYEDEVLFNRVGVTSYRVRPVYVSYEPGDSFSVTLYRRSTVPTIVLPSFRNGQPWRQPSVTVVNSSVNVDTPETSSQAYEDYFSTEIRKSARSNTSSQQAGALKRFMTQSGLASNIAKDRSPPRTTFNLAPVIESSTIISPVNSFKLQALVDAQLSGGSTSSSTLTSDASETSASSRSTSQRTSYRRATK